MSLEDEEIVDQLRKSNGCRKINGLRGNKASKHCNSVMASTNEISILVNNVTICQSDQNSSPERHANTNEMRSQQSGTYQKA